MLKYLVFDFDGTIADSMPFFMEFMKEVLKKYKLKITISEARDLGLQQLILRSKIPLYKIPGIISEGQKKMKERIGEVRPIAGICPVIKKLAKKYTLAIVSSDSRENIDYFLNKNKLKSIFKIIHTKASPFGKYQVLKQLCNVLKIQPNEAAYIGDEDRDIVPAKRLGMLSVGVSWGYNSRKLLEQNAPDHLIDSPNDLLDIFNRTEKD